MPPRRRAVRGKGKKRRMGPKRPRRLGMRRMNREFASASQVLKLGDDRMNSVFTLDNVNLSQFDRLVNIAKNYQYYRITKIEYKITPYADTYQTSGFDGAGNPEPHSSVPYLYWLVNKGESLVNNSFDSLRDAGSRPIRFDDKTVTLRWKPAVNILTRSDSNSPPNYNFALKRLSPWLATNNTAGQGAVVWAPSTVPHLGLIYGVQQDYVVGPEGYNNVYGCEIIVHCQFKKPLNAPGGAKEVGPAISKSLVPVSD